mgnify:FL=1
MPTHTYSLAIKSIVKGFTLLELMVSLSVTSILAAIAVPNFNDFIIKMRVDNEISQLHRILLMTRNAAINSGKKAIICPLNEAFNCTVQWQNKLSVFVDENDNKLFDINEKIILIREAISPDDKLVYGNTRNKITFKPTGSLSGLANGTFRYCPKGYDNLARGIVVARSGRLYQSSDVDNDGIDENRGNKEISCD